MGMNIKLMIGTVVGILVSIVVAVVSLVMTDRGEPSANSEIAPVAVAAAAMDADNDPMDPISPDEADRRATLHNEEAEVERTTEEPAFVATPVVERVGDLGNPDELANKLFDMDLFSSEPQGTIVGVSQEPETIVVEQPPEPEPKEVIVAVEPAPPAEPVVTPDMEMRNLLARGARAAQTLMVVEASNVPQPVITFLERQ